MPSDVGREYLMFFDHKEVFDELQKSTFVAANEL